MAGEFPEVIKDIRLHTEQINLQRKTLTSVIDNRLSKEPQRNGGQISPQES